MRIFSYIIASLFLLAFYSCGGDADLSSSKAKSLLVNYLESNPLYETGQISTSKLRLRYDKDMDLVNQIKDLRKEGFVEIIKERYRERLFSSDTVWVLTPKLTEKSLPYIINQRKNKTEVITLNYKLAEEQDIIFTSKNSNSASANVKLMKERTPFHAFGDETNPNSDFVTKKFKFRHNEERGWYLVD